LRDILADLSKPVPDRFIQQYDKPTRGGSVKIDYIPWHDIARLMDYFAPGWEIEITDKQLSDTHLLLTVRLWIHAAEGRFYRESTGIESLDRDGYGDFQSMAESMAFRRAAARWGLGAHLYRKDN
jgi:hypothetical protein